MQKIIEINDYDLGLNTEPDPNDKAYRTRIAARAVIFNDNNEIALLHVGKHNYHKLPGGGVDGEESWEEGILREALEEIGGHIQLRDLKVGSSFECKNHHGLHQTSYCFLADLIGETIEPKRTKSEIEDQQLPIWVSLDKAISLIEKDAPTDYHGKFIVTRDHAFLKKAQEILQKK